MIEILSRVHGEEGEGGGRGEEEVGGGGGGEEGGGGGRGEGALMISNLAHWQIARFSSGGVASMTLKGVTARF